jgi:hypothetical protein
VLYICILSNKFDLKQAIRVLHISHFGSQLLKKNNFYILKVLSCWLKFVNAKVLHSGSPLNIKKPKFSNQQSHLHNQCGLGIFAFLHFRYFNRLNPYLFELPSTVAATSVLTPLNRENSFITSTPGDLQICCKPKPMEATEGDLNKVSKRSSFLLINLKQFYFDAIEVHFCKTIDKLYSILIK